MSTYFCRYLAICVCDSRYMLYCILCYFYLCNFRLTTGAWWLRTRSPALTAASGSSLTRWSTIGNTSAERSVTASYSQSVTSLSCIGQSNLEVISAQNQRSEVTSSPLMMLLLKKGDILFRHICATCAASRHGASRFYTPRHCTIGIFSKFDWRVPRLSESYVHRDQHSMSSISRGSRCMNEASLAIYHLRWDAC